jgi:hypothetical protein
MAVYDGGRCDCPKYAFRRSVCWRFCRRRNSSPGREEASPEVGDSMVPLALLREEPYVDGIFDVVRG